MRKQIILVATLLTAVCSSSCKKMLDIDSTRLVNEANMWKTVEDAKSGLMGVYGLAKSACSDNNRHWIYGDLRTIDYQGGDFRSTVRLDLKAISDNNLKAEYPLVESLSNWRRFYAAINAANIFIEEVPNILKSDPRYLEQNLKLDVAHARYIRSFMYYYLVRNWGDVPFLLSSHGGNFENKGRVDQKEILAFLESELLEIATTFPVVYLSDQPELFGNDYYLGEEEMAKRHSVYALLAHVYALQGKYADAAIWSKWVIDNMSLPAMGSQRMFWMNADQTRQMFRGEWGSNQYNIIFGFSNMFLNGESKNSGFMEELTLAQPYVLSKSLPAIYVPKDTTLAIFNEPNDSRFFINPITSTPNADRYFGAFDRQYPIFTKVFIIRDNNPPLNTLTGPGSDGSITTYASSLVFTRPEEIQLLLAEANVVLGDRNGAIEILNARRTNKGLPVYSEEIHGDLLTAIFQERRKELMGEGWRWYDYIRYKKIKNDDNNFLNLIKNGGVYWPVAKEILSQNPLVEQTQYWANK